MRRTFDQFKDETRAWDKSVEVYSVGTKIPVVRGCFAVMFTNVGDTTARLGGMVVFPSATPATALGDSRSLAGHELDIYVGTLDLSFAAAPGVTPGVEVVQLYYV